jgi:putative DNA primase/helicase
MSEAIPMPEVAPPVWDNIPLELAALQQWLLWKFEEPEKAHQKWRKTPYYVAGGRRTGEQGSDRDRQRLATLDVVRRAFEKGAWHGVGFAFLPGDGLIGIDIDGAIDSDTGEVSQRCLGIIGACDTFTELSPSGKGCHIIGRGATHIAKSNDIGVEMFCGSQYFTFTGRPWPGAPQEIKPLNDLAVQGLHQMIVVAKAARRAGNAKPPTPPAPRAHDESSEALRTRVQSALDHLAPDMDYEDWISIGWALRDAFDESGFDLWNGWSARGGTYPGEDKLRAHWKSFQSKGGMPDQVVGVIFKRAIQAGWKAPAQRRHKLNPSRKNGSAPAGGAVDGAGGGNGGDEPPPGTGDADPDDAFEPPFFKHRGRPMDCRENVFYALRDVPTLKGIVRLNTFTELHERSRETAWGRPPGEWDEEDDVMLGEQLGREWGLLVKAPGTLRNGVLMAARNHKFNPIVDLIKSQKWDGVERLDHWPADVFEIVDRPYTRLIGRCFIMGMVMRALRPGCKFDYMLILKGDQGLKKSAVFRALAEPWFTDNAIKMGDKDSLMTMQLVWIAESAELESLNKAETTAVKQFLSAQDDMFRPPYGAQIKRRPRHTVVAGTTNADKFLKDATGDRRFWPLEVEVVNLDALRAMRLQLFAEALHRLRQKEQFWPTREQEKELIFPEQERFKKEERWEDYLDAYVNATTSHKYDDPNDPVPCKRPFYSSMELYDKALQIKADRIDGAGQMDTRVANAMKALGFISHRETTAGRRRGWLRKPPDNKPEPGASPTDKPPGRELVAVREDDDLPI